MITPIVLATPTALPVTATTLAGNLGAATLRAGGCGVANGSSLAPSSVSSKYDADEVAAAGVGVGVGAAGSPAEALTVGVVLKAVMLVTAATAAAEK